MRFFIVFIVALFTINAAHAEDTVCNAGYYGNGTTCTKCPDGYPNSDAGATSITECYSNEKERAWTGHQVCKVPHCFGAVCSPCEIKPCKYVAYYSACNWWDPCYNIGTDGAIKSGCETNDANCSTPVQSISSAPGWRTVGTSHCEECPAGTYSAGGENAQCEQCPNGATTFAGATSRGECMRILNYLPTGQTTPTKIYLGMKQNTHPAFAVKIGDDVFYANMTPVDAHDAPGLYVGYNNQKYQVQDNADVFPVLPLYINILITEAKEFDFSLGATGEFTVDWGDGTDEVIIHDSLPEYDYCHSHVYNTSGEYTIRISGRATAYKENYAAIRFGTNENWWECPTSINGDNIVSISGSLKDIFPTLDDGTNPSFKNLFTDASGLQSIPVGLFGDFKNTKPANKMFVNAFKGCTNLTGPTARTANGTRLYDIEYNGEKWIDAYPDAFTDMYTGSGIDTND